jgi:hypothetical protein
MAPLHTIQDNLPLLISSHGEFTTPIEQDDETEAERSPVSQIGDLPVVESILNDRGIKRKAFQRTFDEHMKNRPVRHQSGHVLLLSWDDLLDDLHVKPEV